MQQLIEFWGNHPLLCMAFLGLLGGLLWTVTQGSPRGVTKLNPTDATRLINHDDALVLDVRSDGEFRQGHIINALHIPQPSLMEQLGKLEKYRDRPIITACRTGQVSARASGTLLSHGFEKIYNLGGGILAWENANLPLTKK